MLLQRRSEALLSCSNGFGDFLERLTLHVFSEPGAPLVKVGVAALPGDALLGGEGPSVIAGVGITAQSALDLERTKLLYTFAFGGFVSALAFAAFALWVFWG
jgi:hypothetical protein